MSNIEKTPRSAELRLTAEASVYSDAPSLARLLARAAETNRRDIDLMYEVARFLAAISIHHTALGEVPTYFQGVSNAPVPVEVLALVGEILVGPRTWVETYNTARAEAERPKKEQWQRQAESIWQRNSKLSKTAVGKIIDPDKFNTIRQVIKKPKK